MKQKRHSLRKHNSIKCALSRADLEHAKAAVLNSLTCPDAQRGYRHALDEFVDWYCSEPRLAFNRTVVPRYRSQLDQDFLYLMGRNCHVLTPPLVLLGDAQGLGAMTKNGLVIL